MALSGVNLNSEAFCRKAYLNYHCQGNTMGLTNEDMGKITQAWKDKLSSWQKSVSNDENQYEFDDSEFENYKEKGKKAGEDATGYDGKQGGDYAATIGNAVAGAGGAAVSLCQHGLSAAKNVAVGITSKGAKMSMKDTGWSAYVAAGLAIATALAYAIKKPNKESKEACDKLQGEMNNAQAETMAAQEEMASMGEELMSLSDEANEANEDANDDIKEQKAEYDLYMESYTTLKEKAESGKPLTDSEKELYEVLVKLMTETGKNIDKTSAEASDNVNDIYDDMGTYQDGYDNAAETIGNIEGLTDYAESFDKETRALCYVEGAAQTLNAASGAIAGARLLATGWANWANMILGIASVAAGVTSGVAAGQQFKWAGEVGNEIELRKGTQDLNAATNDVYDIEVDNYGAWMGGVEDLELNIPDDVEAPKDSALPQSAGTEKPEKEEKPKPEK